LQFRNRFHAWHCLPGFYFHPIQISCINTIVILYKFATKKYKNLRKLRDILYFLCQEFFFTQLLQRLKYSKDLRIHLYCKIASTSSASFSPPSTSSDKACRRTLCVSVTFIRIKSQAILYNAALPLQKL
jgi:hypothetical protein